MKIKISADSTCDLSPELIERYHNEKMHNAPLRSPLFAERGLFRQ